MSVIVNCSYSMTVRVTEVLRQILQIKQGKIG